MKLISKVAGGALVMLLLGAAAQAQGPAGAGAAKAAAAENTSGTRSFNPIKWVKRDTKTADDELTSDAVWNEKLTARLREEGLLPTTVQARDACANFKEVADCVAALHVSHKLSLDFECIKVDMTHVHSAADPATCKVPEKDQAIGLTQVIRLLKPDADAKAEAKEAEHKAKDLLKATKS
jgi:hypothetical protein